MLVIDEYFAATARTTHVIQSSLIEILIEKNVLSQNELIRAHEIAQRTLRQILLEGPDRLDSDVGHKAWTSLAARLDQLRKAASSATPIDD